MSNKESSIGQSLAKQKEVASIIANGGSRADAARALDVHPGTITKLFKKKPTEMAALIESEQNKLMDSLPKATENIKHLIDNFLEKDKDNKPVLSPQEKQMGFSASMEMHRGIGSLPGNTQSIVYNQYNQQNNVILAPAIQELLKAQSIELKSLISEPSEDIEAEYEETSQSESL